MGKNLFHLTSTVEMLTTEKQDKTKQLPNFCFSLHCSFLGKRRWSCEVACCRQPGVSSFKSYLPFRPQKLNEILLSYLIPIIKVVGFFNREITVRQNSKN